MAVTVDEPGERRGRGPDTGERDVGEIEVAHEEEPGLAIGGPAGELGEVRRRADPEGIVGRPGSCRIRSHRADVARAAGIAVEPEPAAANERDAEPERQ